MAAVSLQELSGRKRKKEKKKENGSEDERELLLPEVAEELDTDGASRGVWLLKVPRLVADEWQRGRAGDEMGRVHVSPSGKKISLSLPTANESKSSFDEDSEVRYALEAPMSTLLSTGDSTANAPHFYVIAGPTKKREKDENNDGKVSEEDINQFRVEGHVVYRLDARPMVSGLHEKYRMLSRQRTELAGTRVGGTQMLNHSQSAVAQRIVPLKGPSRTEIEKEKRDREFMKRVTGEGETEREEARDKLYDTIFKCFEQRERWSIGDLFGRSQVPVERLREILNEIAIKNSRGPYVNLYQLKPEYRQRSKEEH